MTSLDYRAVKRMLWWISRHLAEGNVLFPLNSCVIKCISIFSAQNERKVYNKLHKKKRVLWQIGVEMHADIVRDSIFLYKRDTLLVRYILHPCFTLSHTTEKKLNCANSIEYLKNFQILSCFPKQKAYTQMRDLFEAHIINFLFYVAYNYVTCETKMWLHIKLNMTRLWKIQRQQRAIS